jgi:predicted nicotinamide N-methyase
MVIKTEIRAYGIRLLLSGHPKIRRLKQQSMPTLHGHRHWASSWLLMDHLNQQGLPKGLRVMEVGCGWGLAGIFCAKKYDAVVTGVDRDPDVFPYLRLHAEVNKVELCTLRKAFGGLARGHLQGVDLLMGADICYWDSMVLSLKRLVGRAIREKVPLVLIADPGRSPFETLADYCEKKGTGEVLDWTTHRPRTFHGRILRLRMD